MLPITLQGSVGRGGRNTPTEVRTVQERLNLHMSPGQTALSIDGLVGPKTVNGIVDFQRRAAGFQYGDGRIDPRGRTLAALNQKAINPAQPSPIPTPYPNFGQDVFDDFPPPVIDLLTDEKKHRLEQLVKKVIIVGGKRVAQELLAKIAHVQSRVIYAIVSMLNSVADVGHMARGLTNLFNAGLRVADILRVRMMLIVREVMDDILLANVIRIIGVPGIASKLIAAAANNAERMLRMGAAAVRAAARFGKQNAKSAMVFLYEAAATVAGIWRPKVDAMVAIVRHYATVTQSFFIGKAMRLMSALEPLTQGNGFAKAAHAHVMEFLGDVASGRFRRDLIDTIISIAESTPPAKFFRMISNYKEWVTEIWGSEVARYIG